MSSGSRALRKGAGSGTVGFFTDDGGDICEAFGSATFPYHSNAQFVQSDGWFAIGRQARQSCAKQQKQGSRQGTRSLFTGV